MNRKELAIAAIGLLGCAVALTALAGQPAHSAGDSIVLQLSRYPSLQECYDALPATGGTIQLPAKTTIVLTNSLVFSKPNLTLRGAGWDSVLQRGEQAGACLLEFGGLSNTVADLTIDGNGLHTTNGKVELRLKADFATVNHVQVRNARKMGIGLRSNGGLVTNCMVTGLGPAGRSSYGIWAIANTTVSVIGNTVRDTFIDGIGLDGTGSRVINNTLTNCHHDPSIGGGQIVVYPRSRGVLIEGNALYRGGNRLSGGIELSGHEITIRGNTILNQGRYGIQLHTSKGDDMFSGFTITGNVLRDCGQPGKWKNQAISVSPHVSQVVIVGNSISADGPDKNKLVGINLFGNNDRIVITNNVINGYGSPVAVGPSVGPIFVLTNNPTGGVNSGR